MYAKVSPSDGTAIATKINERERGYIHQRDEQRGKPIECAVTKIENATRRSKCRQTAS